MGRESHDPDYSIDTGGSLKAEQILECLRKATPTQAERAQLSDGVSTGISALDVLAPIGRGQSLLVCGSQGSGKTTLTCDIIEKLLSSSSFDKVVRFHIDAGVGLDSVPTHSGPNYSEFLVSQSVTSPASCHLAALFDAVAAAEATRDSGGHAALVLDTLAPLIDSWNLAAQWSEEERGASLDPESVAGQRRSFFANMFERAANLARGGSLTMFALVETDAFAAVGPSLVDSSFPQTETNETAAQYTLSDFAGRKESDLERIRRLQERGVPLTEKTLTAVGIAPPAEATRNPQVQHSVAMRELQSLSDGQVILDRDRTEAGDVPAVVTGTSFSRFGLGSTEATPGAPPVQRDVRPTALQAVAAHLRVELALEKDARFRPPVDDAAGATAVEAMGADIAQTTRMEAVKAALLQPPKTHLATEEMVALLLAACSGAFDALPRQKVIESLRGGSTAPFLQHLRNTSPQLLDGLREDVHISTEVARQLDVAIRLFVALQAAP